MVDNITNAPDNLTIQNWKSVMDRFGGPARVSRFIINIVPCKLMLAQSDYAKDLAFMCEATELPGRGFMSTDIRYYGPSYKAPFQAVYDDVVFNFLVRSNFRERQFFDDWMNCVQPIDTFNFKYRSDYISTVDIYQMSDFAASNKPDTPQAQYKITMDKAYPILLAAQPVNWGDESFHRLSVTFTFNRWYRNVEETKTSKFDIVRNDFILKDGTIIPSLIPQG